MFGAANRCRVLLALLLTAVACGCFKQRTLVQIYPDGSARITVTRIVTQQATEAYKEYGLDLDIELSPAAATNLAHKLGSGVSIMHCVPLNSPAARGFAAIYRVDNVNDLNIPLAALIMDLEALEGEFDADDQPPPDEDSLYSFAFDPKTSRVTVTTPDFTEEDLHELDIDDAEEEFTEEYSDYREEALSQLTHFGIDALTPIREMQSRLMGNMEVRFDVETVDSQVQVLSAHRLLEIDLAKTLAATNGHLHAHALTEAGEFTPDALSAHRATPGVTLVTADALPLAPPETAAR